MNFNEAYESLNRIYEGYYGTDKENEITLAGLRMFEKDATAKGIIFGVDTKDGYVEINKLYHNDQELNSINKEIDDKYKNHNTVWSLHDRGAQMEYIKQKIAANKNQKIEQNKKDKEEKFDKLINKEIKKYPELLDFINSRKYDRNKYLEIYDSYFKEIPNTEEQQLSLLNKFFKELDQFKLETENKVNAQEKSAEPQKSKYSATQLTNMRKNNSKIVNAAKEAGLDVSPLIAIGTDKNGRQFKKASPELNKMRKTLFGEDLTEAIEDYKDILGFDYLKKFDNFIELTFSDENAFEKTKKYLENLPNCIVQERPTERPGLFRLRYKKFKNK